MIIEVNITFRWFKSTRPFELSTWINVWTESTSYESKLSIKIYSRFNTGTYGGLQCPNKYSDRYSYVNCLIEYANQVRRSDESKRMEGNSKEKKAIGKNIREKKREKGWADEPGSLWGPFPLTEFALACYLYSHLVQTVEYFLTETAYSVRPYAPVRLST